MVTGATSIDDENLEDGDDHQDPSKTPRRSSRRSNSVIIATSGSGDNPLPDLTGITLGGVFRWPREMVVQRRFDTLYEMMSNPTKYGLDENTQPRTLSTAKATPTSSTRKRGTIEEPVTEAETPSKRQRVGSATNQTSITSFFQPKTGDEEMAPTDPPAQ